MLGIIEIEPRNEAFALPAHEHREVPPLLPWRRGQALAQSGADSILEVRGIRAARRGLVLEA